MAQYFPSFNYQINSKHDIQMNNLICSYMKYILRVWLLKDDLIPFDEILSEYYF